MISLFIHPKTLIKLLDDYPKHAMFQIKVFLLCKQKFLKNINQDMIIIAYLTGQLIRK